MKLIKKYLTNGQYITEPTEKKSIFLHHTCGLNAEGAWRWWNSTPDRVGTAYIIGRDGTVVECFDPSNWAFHLGIKGDHFQDKCSVGIELVSAGGLYLMDGEYRFYPLWPNKTRFTVIPKEDVVSIPAGWRGYKFFHKYTDAQILATEELINMLAEKFPTIPLGKTGTKFYEYNEKVVGNRLGGIWAHSSVREDKSDIYPDVNLLKMVSRLNKLPELPEMG